MPSLGFTSWLEGKSLVVVLPTQVSLSNGGADEIFRPCRVGGMTAATLTAPLDVLKTRLQSDFYQAQIRAARANVPR